jgi:hypothetical protein
MCVFRGGKIIQGRSRPPLKINFLLIKIFQGRSRPPLKTRKMSHPIVFTMFELDSYVNQSLIKSKLKHNCC